MKKAEQLNNYLFQKCHKEQHTMLKIYGNRVISHNNNNKKKEFNYQQFSLNMKKYHQQYKYEASFINSL